MTNRRRTGPVTTRKVRPPFDASPAREIDDFLCACTPRARRLVEAARRRIRRVVPAAVEKLRPGWGLIGYNAPAYFTFIAPARDTVRIGFEWGVMLPDPARLLEGTGSQVRYVTIRSTRDLASPALGALFITAAAVRPPPRPPRSRR